MPLYEYFCPPCNGKFEVLRPVSKMDAPATCPEISEPTGRESA